MALNTLYHFKNNTPMEYVLADIHMVVYIQHNVILKAKVPADHHFSQMYQTIKYFKLIRALTRRLRCEGIHMNKYTNLDKKIL